MSEAKKDRKNFKNINKATHNPDFKKQSNVLEHFVCAVLLFF